MELQYTPTRARKQFNLHAFAESQKRGIGAAVPCVISERDETLDSLSHTSAKAA